MAIAPIHAFQFQRQRVGDKLCLSDYILPAREGARDHLALFVVTAGANIREKSEEAKAAGQYLYSHGIQALAMESAEAAPNGCTAAFAKIGAFPIRPPLTMAERFTSRYRGKRYSFGYPACPNLEDQAGYLETAASRRDRRASHRRDDDGPEASVSAARIPSSRLLLLQRRRSFRNVIPSAQPN